MARLPHWGQVPRMAPPSEWIFRLAGPSENNNMLFAPAHDGRQVFRTMDGGESWQRVYPLS